MDAAPDATPSTRKNLRPAPVGLLLVLLVLLAGIGIQQLVEIKRSWGKWTLGDPLEIPNPDQVAKVELRRWQGTTWIEVPLPASKRLLEALASNNENVPPKHGGATCYLPNSPQFEIRVQTRSGLPLRIAISDGCWRILLASTEGPEGSVPEKYAQGWDWTTWSLREGARRAALDEISGALPAVPAAEDK